MTRKAIYNQAVEAPPPPIDLFIFLVCNIIFSLCTIARGLSTPPGKFTYPLLFATLNSLFIPQQTPNPTFNLYSGLFPLKCTPKPGQAARK